jgi:Calx-beta domain/Domain of unknown function (DUF4214)
MRTRHFSLFTTTLCLALSAVTVIAQTSSGGSYKITSTVIAGGGGSSTGSGNKSIEGTTGQSAAGGPRSGGSISHDAGFWPTTLAQEAPQQGGQTTIQFSAASYQYQEQLGSLGMTVTRSGDTTATSTVFYETVNTVAQERTDFEYASGRVVFAPGETSKTFEILVNEDMYSELNEQFNVVLSKASGAVLGQLSTATVMITDDSPEQSTNPINDAQTFVHMQYHDFLNREPDPAGLAFWTNEITSCGADQTCIDVKRVNVSAAFFLSIEFQQTGYLVHRAHRAVFGSAIVSVPVELHTFLVDTQKIGKGVVVNQPGWQQVLEANKQSYFLDLVQSEAFEQEYHDDMTPTNFVDNLFGNANVTPSVAERQSAIDVFGGSSNIANDAARANALRLIAENSTYATAEFNRAFVLMQYFGYLRRNPNEAPEPGLNLDGFNFWLTKLDQFNGNFVNADMVKAFIISLEYRQRFGQ